MGTFVAGVIVGAAVTYFAGGLYYGRRTGDAWHELDVFLGQFLVALPIFLVLAWWLGLL